MSAFQQGIKTFAPWYMVQRWCGTLIESVGATLDGVADRFDLARSNSLVRGTASFSPCEPDAFPMHSRDRGIRLYPTEPDESKRYRLSIFHQLHQRRGTHRGELEHAQPYFLPGTLPTLRMVIQASDGQSATWHTIDPNGVYSVHVAIPSNWDFDGVPEAWARAWAIIYIPGTRLDGTIDGITYYDDGSEYDGGQVYDGFAPDVLADLISIFADWMSAHCALWGVIVCRDLSLLAPDGIAAAMPDGSTTYPVGNWGTLIDPSTGNPTRDERLDFIFDRGQMVMP